MAELAQAQGLRANRAAEIYSSIGSARLNGLDSEAYLCLTCLNESLLIRSNAAPSCCPGVSDLRKTRVGLSNWRIVEYSGLIVLIAPSFEFLPIAEEISRTNSRREALLSQVDLIVFVGKPSRDPITHQKPGSLETLFSYTRQDE